MVRVAAPTQNGRAQDFGAAVLAFGNQLLIVSGSDHTARDPCHPVTPKLCGRREKETAVNEGTTN
jgi:hypothetical protein